MESVTFSNSISYKVQYNIMHCITNMLSISFYEIELYIQKNLNL